MIKIILIMFVSVFVVFGCSTVEKTEPEKIPNQISEPSDIPDNGTTSEHENSSDEDTSAPNVQNDRKNNSDEDDEMDGEFYDPYFSFRQYLNNESVKQVVDKFMISIIEMNVIDFNACVEWDKVAANAQKQADRLQQYYSIANLNEALSFYYVSVNFLEHFDYYQRKVGSESNVGYGMWKCTPKTDDVPEFQWIVKLNFFPETREWKITQIGNLPKEVLGTSIIRIAVPDEVQGGWSYRKYYFTPAQIRAFNKKVAEDPDYFPQTTDEYDHVVEMKFEKFKDDE